MVVGFSIPLVGGIERVMNAMSFHTSSGIFLFLLRDGGEYIELGRLFLFLGTQEVPWV